MSLPQSVYVLPPSITVPLPAPRCKLILSFTGSKSHRSASDSGRRLTVKRKEFGVGKYSWQGLVRYI